MRKDKIVNICVFSLPAPRVLSDRLRLGIGPSHSSTIEGNFGLSQRKPIVHLREYVEVLRAVLWEGKVNHHGEFFNVVVTAPRNTARLPILVSALGKNAFEQTTLLQLHIINTNASDAGH
jgi:alkanesulfonate monooxygenase SsuD/methylene tetrahydromethanopterin reductase-like flavin-dependent oxidoreductase (luciferase family)